MSNSTSSSTAAASAAVADDSISEPLVGNPATYDALSLFLVQVVIILVLVRILAKVLGRLRQPPVIGEIIAGILLGPSAFGYIPGFSSTIFPTSSLTVLSVFSQIGLIFFMFFLGLEVDASLLTRNWRASAPVAVMSIIIPFCSGIGISYWFYDIEPTNATRTVFLLFMGTAFAFTAFPVLARILTSFRLIDTGVGIHALSIAAIDDVLAWIVLALTLSYAGGGSAAQGVYTMLLVIAYVLVIVFVVRPCLVVLGQWFSLRKRQDEEFSREYVALLFLLLALASIWTEIIGVQAFFGAFAFGIIVPKEYGLVEYLAPKIELLVVEFFLPLYFANSGLSTQLGALNSGALWGKAVALIVIATVSKTLPVTVMTRLTSSLFFVNTEDPEEALEAGAAPAAVDELKVRGDDGVMEVGDELEMGDIIKKQHAEIAGTDGMLRGKQAMTEESEHSEQAAAAAPRVKEEGEEEYSAEEKQEMQDTQPHRLSVSGDQAAVIRPLTISIGEERKDPEPELDVDGPEPVSEQPAVAAAAVQQGGGETELSRLSRRSRYNREGSGGVHFSDLPPLVTTPSIDALQGQAAGSSSAAPSPASTPRRAPRPVPIDWKTCFCIGVLMNTRGLVALIALNIGLQKGILGPKVFSLMVFMALITTFITSPVFDLLFYRPYIAAKREMREQLRREAELQRRLESGSKGGDAEAEEEETETERTARHKAEEEEEERTFQDELNRMTILVRQYPPTPRTGGPHHASPHFLFPAPSPRSADGGQSPNSLQPELGRAHTIGAYPARGSLSMRQPLSLSSLWLTGRSGTHANLLATDGRAVRGAPLSPPPPASQPHSIHLPQASALRSSASHDSLARQGRGGAADSMHSLMQTGPSRVELGAAAGGGATIISSRHPSDRSAMLQTGPSRFHHLAASLLPSAPHSAAVNADGRQPALSASLLHTGPSRVHMMDDIREREEMPQDDEAESGTDRGPATQEVSSRQRVTRSDSH